MRYEKAVKAEEAKAAADEDYIMKIFDPEDFAYGGIAGMLGERTGYAQGLTAKEIKRQDTEKVAEKIAEYFKTQVSYDEKGNQIPIFSKSGKQQVEGLPEGITLDKETINFIASLDIPITEKISLLGDIKYDKQRIKYIRRR